jgi:[ribosomal protein S5]-alanine N-acetyltransferase
VHAVVFDGNPGSERVLDKCGFVPEGLSHRAIFKNGRFLDCRTYARLKR